MCSTCQSSSATSDTARRNSAVTSTPTANSITPNLSSLPSAQYRSNSLLIPRRVRPQHDLGHPNRQMSQSLLQHSKLLMARRHVAVSKLRVHHQVGLCPVGRERADTPCTSCSCTAPPSCGSPPGRRPCPAWPGYEANGSVRSPPVRRSPSPAPSKRRWGKG